MEKWRIHGKIENSWKNGEFIEKLRIHGKMENSWKNEEFLEFSIASFDRLDVLTVVAFEIVTCEYIEITVCVKRSSLTPLGRKFTIIMII